MQCELIVYWREGLNQPKSQTDWQVEGREGERGNSANTAMAVHHAAARVLSTGHWGNQRKTPYPRTCMCVHTHARTHARVHACKHPTNNIGQKKFSDWLVPCPENELSPLMIPKAAEATPTLPLPSTAKAFPPHWRVLAEWIPALPCLTDAL